MTLGQIYVRVCDINPGTSDRTVLAAGHPALSDATFLDTHLRGAAEDVAALRRSVPRFLVGFTRDCSACAPAIQEGRLIGRRCCHFAQATHSGVWRRELVHARCPRRAGHGLRGGPKSSGCDEPKILRYENLKLSLGADVRQGSSCDPLPPGARHSTLLGWSFIIEIAPTSFRRQVSCHLYALFFLAWVSAAKTCRLTATKLSGVTEIVSIFASTKRRANAGSLLGA